MLNDSSPYEEYGGGGADDLRAVPAEAHLLGGGPRGDVDGEEGDHEGGEIGEKVRGVCGNGQRVGHEPSDDFHRHEEEAEDAGGGGGDSIDI